jgi:hypothetical protein
MLSVSIMCAIIICLVLFYVCNYYYVLVNATKNVPGPKTYPLVGDLNVIKHRYGNFYKGF